jgi:hypothetical protein
MKPLTIEAASKEIDSHMSMIREKILQLVGDRPFSISTDEATTKSMNLQCLGIIVHFINVDLMQIQSAAIDLSEVTESPTAEYLNDLAFNSISNFGLDARKLVRVVSDGAANMRLAFK